MNVLITYLVFRGVGSNPTLVIVFTFLAILWSRAHSESTYNDGYFPLGCPYIEIITQTTDPNTLFVY